MSAVVVLRRGMVLSNRSPGDRNKKSVGECHREISMSGGCDCPGSRRLLAFCLFPKPVAIANFAFRLSLACELSAWLAEAVLETALGGGDGASIAVGAKAVGGIGCISSRLKAMKAKLPSNASATTAVTDRRSIS